MQFHVPTLTCGHCVRSITRAIRALDPQAHVEVDLTTQRVDVASDRSADQIVAALAAQDHLATPMAEATPAASARSGCCGTSHG